MRKTREVRRFAAWCFGRLGIAPAPIRYINYWRLVDPNDEYCFGCYTYGEEDTEPRGIIHLAYKLPKFSVMINAAHEIWHHYQNVNGTIRTMTLEECEKEAEAAGYMLLKEWLIHGGYIEKEVLDNEYWRAEV